MKNEQGKIIIYQTEGGQSLLEVHLGKETVWLTLNQMADLFERDKSVISRHLQTIYSTGELDKGATVAKNATVQDEGGRKVSRETYLICSRNFPIKERKLKRLSLSISIHRNGCSRNLSALFEVNRKRRGATRKV